MIFMPAPRFTRLSGARVVDVKQGYVAAGGAALINMPANRADTLVVAWLAGASSTTADAPTISGFTSNESENAPVTSIPRFRMMYKVNPGATAILDPNSSIINAAYIIWSISGATNTLGFSDSNKTSDDSPPATPDPPSITTLADNSLVMAFGAVTDITADTGWTAPSGYSGLAVQSANDQLSQNAVIMGAWKVVPAAGAENPGAFSHASAANGWGAVSLRLAPA